MRKPKSVKIGHRVYFEWVDSIEDSGWKQHAEGREIDLGIRTIGIVVRATKDFLEITTSITAQGNINSPLAVPWVAIKKFKQYEKISG